MLDHLSCRVKDLVRAINCRDTQSDILGAVRAWASKARAAFIIGSDDHKLEALRQ